VSLTRAPASVSAHPHKRGEIQDQTHATIAKDGTAGETPDVRELWAETLDDHLLFTRQGVH
jgi:hypothetical protein